MLLSLGNEIIDYINFLLHKFLKFLIFYNYVFIKYFNICLTNICTLKNQEMQKGF